ncbi:hypothetical protein [Nocardioides speluncae]|uniref:hypothetical protein n=1 Tax=Nocardioides speluncae TaxID=2670337 RepID=UPI000D68B8B0|nr:hypothetical protein [Nocardioides speluncae]
MASIVVQIRVRLDSAKADGGRAADALATAVRNLDQAHALLSGETLGSNDPQLKAATAAVQRLSAEAARASAQLRDACRRASDWGHQL